MSRPEKKIEQNGVIWGILAEENGRFLIAKFSEKYDKWLRFATRDTYEEAEAYLNVWLGRETEV